uniref:Uncharacterized protein n=1 Tax=Helianthus annuus TaxID=4232 RepID=A0A251VF24_HELAN
MCSIRFSITVCGPTSCAIGTNLCDRKGVVRSCKAKQYHVFYTFVPGLVQCTCAIWPSCTIRSDCVGSDLVRYVLISG